MNMPGAHRGFTLIEQLVAATVMLVVFIAVTQAFIGIGIVNSRSDAQTEAVELMQQKLEVVRNTPFNNLAVGTTDFSGEMDAFATLKSPRTATVTVTEVVPSTLKRVDISLSYTQSGKTRSVGTSTLVGLRGINR
jgi:prepilin-type N-terminal cleavage/methylation domain-containing protein